MRAPRALRLRISELNDLSRDVALYCLAFAVLRTLAVLGRPPALFGDSPSYMQVNFFGHATRLWTVPLIYKALPNDEARVVAQIVIAIACWAALAFSVSLSLKNPLVARLGAILVLLLGLCIQVTEWDHTILSESVALSLTVLLVAALLWLYRSRGRRALIATLAVLVLWAFTRQLQAVMYVLVSLPVIAWILLRARRYLLVALALAILAAWAGYASSQANTVIRCNTYYLITRRVVLAPGGVEFLARHNMPALPKVEGCSRLSHTDPELLTWIDNHWTSAYAEWLLRHPVSDIRQPLAEAPGILSGFPAIYGSPRPVLPSPVQDGLWERSSGDLPLWLAVIAVASLVASRIPRRSGLAALGVGAIGFALLWYLVAWQLSSVELPRIAVESAAVLRIGIFLVLLAALDRIALNRPAEGRSSAGRRRGHRSS